MSAPIKIHNKEEFLKMFPPGQEQEDAEKVWTLLEDIGSPVYFTRQKSKETP